MSSPKIYGYQPVAHYDCGSCKALVLVVYAEQPGAMPEAEDRYGHRRQGWLERRFGGGTTLAASSHASGAQTVGCPFRLPDMSGAITHNRLQFKRDAIAQQIYAALMPWSDRVAMRIVDFDIDAFLAAPFVCAAPAREAGQPPMFLVATPGFIVAKLLGKPIPANGYWGFPRGDMLRAAELYLATIKAQTRPIFG
jgi:hypothetical protein